MCLNCTAEVTCAPIVGSEIFEDVLELEIGLLEAGLPTAESYPYPSLTPTTAVVKRKFHCAILENPYLRATFVPGLGGRLLSLVDKRSSVELLPQRLETLASGVRGATLTNGIELHLQGHVRHTSLAAVQFATEDPDEERPAGLWLGEAVTGTGMSWHLHVFLPEDRAELRLEARIFNRTVNSVFYNAGLLVGSEGTPVSDDHVFLTSSEGRGIALIPDRGSWSASRNDGRLRISRFESPRTMAGRQLDTWSFSIVPFSNLGRIVAASRNGALSVEDEAMRVQSTGQLAQHKLVLLTGQGETLEAPVDIYPEKVLEMKAPDSPSAVALLDPGKKALLSWNRESALREIGPGQERPTDRIAPIAFDGDLNEETFDVPTRHIAQSILGTRALAAQDYEEAEYRFEQSLLYNGEDHLTWWLKAVAKRLKGEQFEEIPELLNAHYLAPLEPALRAESYLSQPQSMEKEPNPLLKPLDEYPETYIEVASLLLDAGLYEQAGRWIDESLRHVDLPILRYLLGYSHLQVSKLDFEAAKQVSAASRMPLGPPYPWRAIERKAITTLAERFPSDERLKKLVELIGEP